MTPKLQQAIKLLQLSTLELTAEIYQAMEANPLLDAEEIAEDTPPTQRPEAKEDQRAEGPTTWESSLYPSRGRDKLSPREMALELAAADDGGLREHLRWQLDLGHYSKRDRVIAESIVDAVGDDGYLTESPDEIYRCLSQAVMLDYDEMQAVLHRVQHLDPVGVACADVRECLQIQLGELDGDSEGLAAAQAIVAEHLELLSRQDMVKLRRLLKVDEAEIRAACELIRSLDPKPGSRINSGRTEYITPDLVVYRDADRWRVRLEDYKLPRLHINHYYAGLIDKTSGSDASYIRGQLREARWFIKSLETRNDTLLRVGQYIIDRQAAFFDLGEEAMQPLVLREVAAFLDLHESTISRATSRKYLRCARGVFELKYFFSSHVPTVTGGACSATAIRAKIARMIATESARHPLSDASLAESLRDEGVAVARRTVAKYREAMAIPSSSHRKRLI